MKFVLILIQELCLAFFALIFYHVLLEKNDTNIHLVNVQQQALTVLEYIVANGSERVIEEIREHAHQISVISILSIANIYKLFSLFHSNF